MADTKAVYEDLLLWFDREIDNSETEVKEFTTDFAKDPEYALRSRLDGVVQAVAMHYICEELRQELVGPMDDPAEEAECVTRTIDFAQRRIQERASGLRVGDGRMKSTLEAAKLECMGYLFRFNGPLSIATRRLMGRE